MKCYDYGGECEYWLTIDGKVLSKQKFKKGQLLKEDKTPYSQEEIHRMAFRQIGELPIDPDTIEWPSHEEETKNNMASSKEGVFQKLFKRFFSL